MQKRCPSARRRGSARGPAVLQHRQPRWQVHWLARPRPAESARAGAGETACDLQIWSGIIHAGFACGPCCAAGAGSAASLAGATALPAGDIGWQRGSPSPPASPRTINRPHTQLRSLSPRAEPQMYFMGERLPRRVVKHPRGCGAAGGGCCWAPRRVGVCGTCVCKGAESVGAQGCVDGWWVGVQDRLTPCAPQQQAALSPSAGAAHLI